ncbi:MAG: hypothetical protein ACXWC9_01990 [Pseudobdellovibrionaceae bacterium]
MNLKLTLTVLSALVLSFVACSKNKGSEPLSETPPVVQVADLSKIPSFESFRIISPDKASSYAHYIEARFGSSCKIRRDQHGAVTSYQDRQGFDPSLKIGDSAYVSVQLSNQGGNRKIEQKYQVKNSSILKSRVIRTTYSMFLPAAGGEILSKPILEFESCIFVDGVIECKNESKSIDEFRPSMTTQGFDYLKTHPNNQFDSCFIQNSTSLISKVELGRLYLQDGQAIEAYRTTEIVKGPVMCGDQLMGEGEVTSYNVASLDVKAIPSIREIEGEMQSCGGATVINSHVVQVGGKIVDSYRFEQLKPALK